MHVNSSLKKTANRFGKSVRASLQGRATDKGIERSPEGPAVPQMRCRFAILFPGAGLRGRYSSRLSQSHNGDGRAHPGEKCTLVCRMVAKISDHLVSQI